MSKNKKEKVTKTVLISQKNYEGFESLSDLSRDTEEAVDSEFNDKAQCLDGEFQGTLTVRITYTK
jgi:hypothetical protein